MTLSRWQFRIDRDRIFTEVVARRPDGALATAKVDMNADDVAVIDTPGRGWGARG